MRLSGRKTSLFTRSWTQRQRVVLLALIGLNTAAFVAQLLLEYYQPGFVREYLALSNRGVRDACSWQFITAIFLHAAPWHFFGNMLVLYVLGRDVESILGQRHFLCLYLAGAVGGEFSHLFLMPADSILFAASGGVAAIVVAYATILPELELISARFFSLPFRPKAKYLGYGITVIALTLLCFDRKGTVIHSAYLGGSVGGWLYAHLLGFGRTSFLQRLLRQRRAATERFLQLTPEQLITEKIDPLLDKISRGGVGSLTRAERRVLARARERILEQSSAE
jgi:membrane associated rhomboid family serine protease